MFVEWLWCMRPVSSASQALSHFIRGDADCCPSHLQSKEIQREWGTFLSHGSPKWCRWDLNLSRLNSSRVEPPLRLLAEVSTPTTRLAQRQWCLTNTCQSQKLTTCFYQEQTRHSDAAPFFLISHLNDTMESCLELLNEKYLELKPSFQEKKKIRYFLSVIPILIPLVWSFPMHSLLRTIPLDLSAHHDAILLKKYTTFTPPQRIDLFWLMINVKQISFQHSNII